MCRRLIVRNARQHLTAERRLLTKDQAFPCSATPKRVKKLYALCKAKTLLESLGYGA